MTLVLKVIPFCVFCFSFSCNCSWQLRNVRKCFGIWLYYAFHAEPPLSFECYLQHKYFQLLSVCLLVLTIVHFFNQSSLKMYQETHLEYVHVKEKMDKSDAT